MDQDRIPGKRIGLVKEAGKTKKRMSEVKAANPVAPRPSLPALTAVRAFTAVNILLFHFSDPKTFGPLAPVIDGGYVSVSFFFVLSGYIMAYNYGERAQNGTLNKGEFWSNRLARLYPVFLLSLVISWQMLALEWHAQPRGMFWLGVVLTPLMLEAWQPVLATFWSTPAWALSVEIFLYACFPWVARLRGPKNPRKMMALWWGVWGCGLILPVLYIWLKPDGPAIPDRFSAGWWIRALKYFPVQHLPTFVCGILLAEMQGFWKISSRVRVTLALGGIFVGYGVMDFAYHFTTKYWIYPLLHDPLMVPLYACIILGLSADHWLTWVIARPWFVALGEASYCLYILHFNIWQILHDDGLLAWLRLSRWDPWISYAIIIAVAMVAYRWVELPARKWLRHVGRRKFLTAAPVVAGIRRTVAE
jgi:peptidoglycan/LPS O-acetylase OafA/YrhL